MAKSIRPWKLLDAAARIQIEVDTVGLGPPARTDPADMPVVITIVDKFDMSVTAPEIIDASRPMFVDEHYAGAVHRAFMRLNNAVKTKSGLATKDGAALMTAAFSARHTVLRLNAGETGTDRDEQLGYMQLFEGAMTGIRNPRAHEDVITDDPERALEMIILASHLMRQVSNSTLRLT